VGRRAWAMKPDFEDLLEKDQAYRAGYLAGAADALLEAHPSADVSYYGVGIDGERDEADEMRRRPSWQRGYERGFEDHQMNDWRLPE
jgi:hypothetical protein